jgi:predicted ABC-class ATPase
MARLVADDREPIVPFVRRAAQLSTEHAISSILVLGGTGDYFSIADAVVVMDAFSPRDATADAKALAGPPPPPCGDAFRATPRILKPCVADGRTGCKALNSFQYGDNNDCDVSGVEQLVEVGQTRACCAAIMHAAKLMAQSPLAALLDVLDALDLDAIQPAGRRDGDLARPRRYEVAAALNRLRTATFEVASPKRGRDEA